MKDFKFEETDIYKEGAFHIKLGQLLCNPTTTIEDLAEFAVDNECILGIKMFGKKSLLSQNTTEEIKND